MFISRSGKSILTIILLLTNSWSAAQHIDNISTMDPDDVKSLCTTMLNYYSPHGVRNDEIKKAVIKFLPETFKWKVVYSLSQPTTQNYTAYATAICYVSGPLDKVTVRIQYSEKKQ
ncbi:hypothetical protein DC3_00400 [Deinococcus cellulosilyticus NBRC 106333 = KACC 11606]|uniref:DUF3888 domain-containing protein n=1 Tax=Deinococcus cellulosilyticus (strain DSM 18568 / NBRC 106333 / KACC 11606 / 5516J-15) TaxID=1223518 RepID=A0A511MUY8_DEIC1|nr:hypothetical protein DC3_00400 [Deinococcus cellulosilyticus NBRC 106333 = KACC 11606]